MHDVLQIDLSRSMVSLKIENDSEWYWFKEVVLMQSTGLKDKNGVEIFDGDLVKPKRDEPFVIKHFIKGQGIIKHVDIGAYGHSFEGIYSGEELEVIVSIYENPELLEEEK